MPAPFPLPPGGLFHFSSLLLSCIRPSLSTQAQLISPQTATCPLESTTKTNPCSNAPYWLWQQLMVFSLPIARSPINVFMLLPLRPTSHSSGSEWICVKAPCPANVERSPGTEGGNPARCSWSGNQTSCSEVAVSKSPTKVSSQQPKHVAVENWRRDLSTREKRSDTLKESLAHQKQKQS